MAKLISADLTSNKLCILEYTTTDGQMLSLKEDKFDAKIVSHTYTDVGKIIFQKLITEINDRAFVYCSSITSITNQIAQQRLEGRCLCIAVALQV